jgi:hypothetical protein
MDIVQPASARPAEETDWASVATGLSVQCWSHIFLLLGMVIMLAAQVITTLDAPSSTSPAGNRFPAGVSSPVFDEGTRRMVVATGGLFILVGWLMAPIAGCYCLAVPHRRKAQGPAAANLMLGVLIVLVFAMCVVLYPRTSRTDDREIPQWAAGVGLMFLFDGARLTVLAFLLRGIGRNLTRPQGAEFAQLLGYLSLILMTSVLLTFVVVYVPASPGLNSPPRDTALLTMLNFALPAAYLVVLALGLSLMSSLQTALARHQ